MMFLLAARRMARGYSRLRQWLIMLARMAAIAGLVFAVSRPLASGWLGLAAGGRADTTIDSARSFAQHAAAQRRPANRSSKPAASNWCGRLQTLGSDRWVLIDSATHEPRELESPAALEHALCRAGQRSGRPAGDAASGVRLYPRQSHGPNRDLDMLGPARERLARRTAVAGRVCATRFWNCHRGCAFHLLAYPQAGDGQRGGARHRRAPPGNQ